MWNLCSVQNLMLSSLNLDLSTLIRNLMVCNLMQVYFLHALGLFGMHLGYDSLICKVSPQGQPVAPLEGVAHDLQGELRISCLLYDMGVRFCNSVPLLLQCADNPWLVCRSRRG
jgi:hypothetical protein